MTDATGFIHKYYDWAAFEGFVKELYESEGDVVVERDVTETDKYGARRQTDVKITKRTRLHTYVTLVECKRWKDPVSRDRIDVIAASVEALGAQKGAVFTTTGYEEGAAAYAKGKGIDIFVIRDLKDEEWGLPGRRVQFWLQVWSGVYAHAGVPNGQMVLLIDEAPKEYKLDLRLGADRARDIEYDLYSVKTGQRGANLVNVMADAHGMILKAISQGMSVFGNGEDGVVFELSIRIEIDFSRTAFHQLRVASGALRIGRVEGLFVAHALQSNMKFDRGHNLEFALVVENFLTDKKLTAQRIKNSPDLHFLPLEPGEMGHADDALKNGSILKVQTSPWIGLSKDPPTLKAVAGNKLRVWVETDAAGTPKLALESLPIP